MKIVIIGAGIVGYTLAEQLSARNHQVSVIDHDAERIQEIANKLDVFALQGSATSPAVLREIDLAHADMCIAVTPQDDANLLACTFAMHLGVKTRIARVKSSEYTSPDSPVDLATIGITHVIEPEKELVRKILQYVELPGVTQSANFQFENVYLRGYHITDDMPIAGKTLYEIAEMAQPMRILTVLIVREGRSVLPSGQERILPGDEIICMMASEALPVFRRLVGYDNRRPEKIIVYGDTLTAIHLAKSLVPIAERVLLVDPDVEHGRAAASTLSNVEVLEGDCTNVELLQEIHVENAFCYIAAGDDTEDNIMSCLLARAEGARSVIAVSNNDRHTDLFLSLGVNRIVNPRRITSQVIIGNVIKVPIGALLTLADVDVEVNRFVASRRSRLLDKPLHTLDTLFRKSIIICAVFRGEEAIIPTGETVIKAGDEVLVLHRTANAALVKRLFGRTFGLGS